MKENGVKVLGGCDIRTIIRGDDHIGGSNRKSAIEAKSYILCTEEGLSYPATGSTGATSISAATWATP